MVKQVAPFVLVLAALWITWCAGVSNGRARADAVRADSVSRVIGDSVSKAQAAFRWRDSVRNDSVAHLQRLVSQQQGAVASLRSRLRPVVDTAQLAMRDSIISQQDTVIAQQAHELTLAQVMVASRDTLLALKDRQIQALTVARDEWKRVAQPSLISRAGRVLPYVAAGLVLGKLL